mmetsp:Transcript_35701/g.101788  ORF Transcript_35701/g.101788 Transcript_35701/m.101788 type:complete len:132 (-) Transcript_35701:221-616(-)
MSLLSKDAVWTGGDPISRSDIRIRLLFVIPLVCRLFFRLNDFAVSAEMKTTIPTTCSNVHSLSNNMNERKRVVALRAVEVIDMVKAPKFFVIAAEQEEPKNPMELKRTITQIFPVLVHDLSSRGTLDCCSA